MRRYLLPGLCVLALVLALHTMTLASAALGDLPLEQAEVVAKDGTRHAFSVRLADTPGTRARGLMYVTDLEPDHGMLFDFRETRRVGMWAPAPGRTRPTPRPGCRRSPPGPRLRGTPHRPTTPTSRL